MGFAKKIFFDLASKESSAIWHNDISISEGISQVMIAPLPADFDGISQPALAHQVFLMRLPLSIWYRSSF
jgi:hypothetical protein